MRMKPVLLSLSILAASAANLAHANLITNGGFELTTNGGNKRLSNTTPTTADRTTLVGWTSSNGNDGGYNFVLNPSTATTSSSALQLYGNNGFSASPTGGNFFVSDPLYYPGYLYQSVGNLTVGASYLLTFDYALAQQASYTGANLNDYWQVGFGNTVQNTNPLSIDQGGFSGWKSASMSFTATSATQFLSFLAKGSSAGAPPFMLLDNVSMDVMASKVPEPATWSLMLGGLGVLGFMARRRRNKQA